MLKNRTTFFFLLFTWLAGSTVILANPVKEVKFVGPFEVRKPLISDTVNVKGEKFGDQLLLKTAVNPELVKNSEIILNSDSLGFDIPEAETDYALQLYGFNLTTDRFTQGTLTVTASGMFELYVNGEKKKDKTATGVKDTEVKLTLLPAYLYEVTIKYLCERADTLSSKLKIAFTAGDDAEIIATLSGERLYNFTEMMEGINVAEISLSPGGEYALLTYTETLKGGSQSRSVHLTDTRTHRILARFTGDLAQARWMPGSTLVYYTRKKGGNRQLCTVDPVTMEEKLLAEHLPEGAFTVSPNEQFLIFSIEEKGPEEDKKVQQVLNPADRIDGYRTRSFLHRFDLRTGMLQRLTYGYRTTFLNDISKDSRYLLFTTRDIDYTQRPYSSTSLFRMELETLRTDTIWSDNRHAGSAKFSPDGKELLVSGSGDAFGGIGLNIAPGQIANSYDGQLFILNPEIRQARAVTRDFHPSVGRAAAWSEDGRIYFTAEEGDYQRVYKLNPVSGNIEALPLAEEYVQGFAVAARGGKMIWYGEGVRNDRRIYLTDLKSRKTVCLDDRSSERLAGIRLGEVYDWDFVSEQGSTIQGRYYLPPGFDPAKRYPMIVYYYGGTSPTGRTLSHPYSMQAFAAQGYVVYVLQPSGTTGYGQEFSSRHVNAWGAVTADEIIYGTQQFIREHPFVDGSKVGCIGASYGGFMTQYLQTRTDLFAAAVSHAGISNITSYWGEGYWGFGYSQVASADSYPWNNPRLYTEQSPLFSADKIHTPLLFLHGTEDTNVPIGESIQMFQALKILGRETAFIQVKGENHGIRQYDRRLKWHNTTLAWFAKYLKGEPQWWDHLYPEKNL